MDINKIIKENKLTVGIVGLGYVGLPLAVEFAKAKVKTFGFDVNDEKVNLLNNKKNYIEDVSDNDLFKSVDGGFFKSFFIF